MRPERPGSPVAEIEPPRDCPLCPRLVDYRQALRAANPDWWNAPVEVVGGSDAWLAIVGLAPGARGANRTGFAFVGDDSGLLLHRTLARHELAEDRLAGSEEALRLNGVAIVNAVRCVPPANKPRPAEIAACRAYFAPVLARLDKLEVIVALGRIAHDAVVREAGGRLSAFRFGHLAEHRLPGGRLLIDSYHCSRYNQNTGRLTPEMFDRVFARAREARLAST